MFVRKFEINLEELANFISSSQETNIFGDCEPFFKPLLLVSEQFSNPVFEKLLKENYENIEIELAQLLKNILYYFDPDNTEDQKKAAELIESLKNHNFDKALDLIDRSLNKSGTPFINCVIDLLTYFLTKKTKKETTSKNEILDILENMTRNGACQRSIDVLRTSIQTDAVPESFHLAQLTFEASITPEEKTQLIKEFEKTFQEWPIEKQMELIFKNLEAKDPRFHSLSDAEKDLIFLFYTQEALESLPTTLTQYFKVRTSSQQPVYRSSSRRFKIDIGNKVIEVSGYYVDPDRSNSTHKIVATYNFSNIRRIEPNLCSRGNLAGMVCNIRAEVINFDTPFEFPDALVAKFPSLKEKNTEYKTLAECFNELLPGYGIYKKENSFLILHNKNPKPKGMHLKPVSEDEKKHFLSELFSILTQAKNENGIPIFKNNQFQIGTATSDKDSEDHKLNLLFKKILNNFLTYDKDSSFHLISNEALDGLIDFYQINDPLINLSKTSILDTNFIHRAKLFNLYENIATLVNIPLSHFFTEKEIEIMLVARRLLELKSDERIIFSDRHPEHFIKTSIAGRAPLYLPGLLILLKEKELKPEIRLGFEEVLIESIKKQKKDAPNTIPYVLIECLMSESISESLFAKLNDILKSIVQELKHKPDEFLRLSQKLVDPSHKSFIFDLYLHALQLKYPNDPIKLVSEIAHFDSFSELSLISRNAALFMESLNIKYNRERIVLDEDHTINKLSFVAPSIAIIPTPKVFNAPAPNDTKITFTDPQTSSVLDSWSLPQPILDSMGLGNIHLSYKQTEDKKVKDSTTGEFSHTITLDDDGVQETKLFVKKHTKDGTRYSKRIFRENAEKLVYSLIEDLEKEKGKEGAKAIVELLRDHLQHYIDKLESEPELTDDSFEEQITPLINERDNFISIIARTWQEAKDFSHLSYKKLLKKMRSVEQDYIVRHDSNTHIICEIDFEKSPGAPLSLFSTQQVFAKLTPSQKEAVKRKKDSPALQEQVRYHTKTDGKPVLHQAHPSHARNVEGLSNAYHSHVFVREGDRLTLKFEAYRHSVYPPIEVKDKILRQAMAMRNAEQLLHQIILDKLQNDPDFQEKIAQGIPIDLTLATQNLLTSSFWQAFRRRGENENRQLAEINLALKSISGTHSFTYPSNPPKAFAVNIRILHVNNEVNMSGEILRKFTRSRHLLAGESAYLINRPGIVQFYGDGISKILSLLKLHQDSNTFEPSISLIEKNRQIITEELDKTTDKTNQAIKNIMNEAGFSTNDSFVNPLNPFEVNYDVVRPLYNELIKLSQEYENAIASNSLDIAPIRRKYNKLENLISSLRRAIASHYEVAYDAIKKHHNIFIENLEQLLNSNGTAIENIPVFNGYNLKDFIQVFNDYQKCYFDLRSNEAHKYEGPARFLLAQKMLGYEVELGCKSSEDRTSRAFNKIEELIILREKTGSFPRIKPEQHPYQDSETIHVSEKIHRQSSGNVITGLNDAPGLQVEQELAGEHLGFNRFDKWVAGHFPKYTSKLPKAAYLLKKRYKHQLALMQGEFIEIIKYSKSTSDKGLLESQINALLLKDRITASELYATLKRIVPTISDEKLKARVKRTLAITSTKNTHAIVWKDLKHPETEQKATKSLTALRNEQEIYQQKIQDLEALELVFNKILEVIKLSSASFIFTNLVALQKAFGFILDELASIKDSLSKNRTSSYEAIKIYDAIESGTAKANVRLQTVAQYFNAPIETARSGIYFRKTSSSTGLNSSITPPLTPTSSSVASDKALSVKTQYYVTPESGDIYTTPHKSKQKLHYEYREENNDALLEYTPSKPKVVKAPRQITGFSEEEKQLIKSMVEHTHSLGWTSISLGGEKRLMILAYIYFTAYDEAKIRLGLANKSDKMQFSFDNTYANVTELQKDAARYSALAEELKEHYIEALSIVNEAMTPHASSPLSQKGLFKEFQETAEKIKKDAPSSKPPASPTSTAG